MKAKGMVGLEIHTYLKTREKLFCKCKSSRERGLKENILICPICTGQPGAKPMATNKEAVKKAIILGLMLNCRINSRVKWMRKHYDWPDLPKGYQTTQSGSHSIPLGENGEFNGIRIESVHLEEDPASWDPQSGRVDYNRSGLPLVEIVTGPDFHFPEEVIQWLEKLVHALSYLKIVESDAGVKVDVNVSLTSPRKTERVEIKNVNSIDSVARAIEFEFERQSKEGSVRETRRFDELKGKTFSMRMKEKQDDYRFIADPDLIDIEIGEGFVNELRNSLPEMPEKKLEKLVKKHKLEESDAKVLAKNLDIVEFFEKVADKVDAGFALPWISGELLRILNWNKKKLDEVEIEVEHFVRLLKMVEKKVITELQAKQILNKFVPKSFDPSRTEGKIDDKKELEKVIEKIIGRNKKAVEDYKNGDTKALNFLMGEVMNATNRRADYKISLEILKRMLK